MTPKVLIPNSRYLLWKGKHDILKTQDIFKTILGPAHRQCTVINYGEEQGGLAATLKLLENFNVEIH